MLFRGRKKASPLEEFTGEVREYTFPFGEVRPCGEDFPIEEDAEYDPEIDVEWTGGTPSDPDSARKKALFENYEPLPPEQIEITCETGDPAGFSGRVLLASSGADRFLQNEPEIQRMFERTYAEAWEDYHGFLDPAMTGRGDLVKRINGSVFDLRVTLTISGEPGRYRASAVLLINPDE